MILSQGEKASKWTLCAFSGKLKGRHLLAAVFRGWISGWGLEYHAINIIAQGRKEHTRQRITPPHQQQARHGEKVHPFPFLLFHSGGDHQRAHGQGQDQRADKLNRWAARYSLSIIPSMQRAIPMHGTATTSPMPGRGRWAQGRGAHPCQGSRYYPIGVCANGRPPRPSPLFCDF